MDLLHANIIGAGKPIIILHGFLGMGDNWKTIGKQLSKQGFEVHLLDQRNHGKSFHRDAFNYNLLVEDLNTYCNHYHLENIILIGHSMGGKTAMFFASMYPNRIYKLIIADISPRYYPVYHDVILEGLSALDFNVIKSRNEADTFLSNYVNELGKRRFLLKNLYWIEKGKLALRANIKVLKQKVNAIGEALPKYNKFNGKTLFLRGENSDYIIYDDELLIEEHFPKAQIQTILNAGHWVHAENPDDFFNKTLDFIKQ